MNSNFKIKCPRCGKMGKLRLKDKRYNSVEIRHYDSEKYKKGKAGGGKSHYLGTMKDPNKLIGKIFEKSNIIYTESQKVEFVKSLKKFTKSIKENKNTDITQTEITEIASILNELKKIRKIMEIEFKITDRVFSWDHVQCQKCGAKLGKFEVKIRGIQNKLRIRLYYQRILPD